MVMQFTDVFSLWKANRMDLVRCLGRWAGVRALSPSDPAGVCGPRPFCLQLIWVVTFVATILLNLDLGLAVAVVFSLMLVVVRTQM